MGAVAAIEADTEDAVVTVVAAFEAATAVASVEVIVEAGFAEATAEVIVAVVEDRLVKLEGTLLACQSHILKLTAIKHLLSAGPGNFR